MRGTLIFKNHCVIYKYYRKEAWERVRSIKLEYGGRRIHDELQSHLESFLDKVKINENIQ